MLLGDSADNKEITFKQMIVENLHLAGTGHVTKVDR